MDQAQRLYQTPDGQAYCWCEQDSSVMLKAVTKFGDPVELTKDEAIELAHALLDQAESIK